MIGTFDGGGNALGQYAYLPYGETPAPLTGTTFGYAGYRYDAETGLYHTGRRFYDPGSGRFLMPDPIGYTGGINLYAYVGSDPLNLTDPSGLIAVGAVNAALQGKGGGGSGLLQNVQLVIPIRPPPLAVGTPTDDPALGATQYLTQTFTNFAGEVASIYNAVASPGAYDYRSRALLAAGIDPASADVQNYDVHHIVAVTAIAAQPARDAGIGIHDLQNLVVVSTQFHQTMQTSAYYDLVNFATFAGWNSASAAGVSAALATLKVSLTAKGGAP